MEKIATNFGAYAHHLRVLHQGGGTYVWGPLSSIFHRFEGLAENSAEKDVAELLLLWALDDSRAGYHDLPHNYVEGKDYTCQKGLEERLLDLCDCLFRLKELQ